MVKEAELRSQKKGFSSKLLRSFVSKSLIDSAQAKNLYKRLYEHLQTYEQNACVKAKVTKYICHFKFALLSIQEERDGAERALYLHYKPACNDPDAIPSGPDVDINPD
jgi:hypothetical protein